MGKPVIIHIPHSSADIPGVERRDIIIDDDSLYRERLAVTDWYTDELFGAEGIQIHKNHYSRLLFDPERFRDDSEEIMSQHGMGVIYTKTLDGRVLRNLTASKREEMVRKYYDPYHRELEEKVERLVSMYGKCLIVDGHSFPGKPFPFESDKTSKRPDICIGTDDFHTPEALVREMENYIEGNGFTVKRNFPFAGTMVPIKHYRKDKRVKSVMIEVNRSTYMNEETGEKSSEFDRMRSFISGLVSRLCDF